MFSGSFLEFPSVLSLPGWDLSSPLACGTSLHNIMASLFLSHLILGQMGFVEKHKFE